MKTPKTPAERKAAERERMRSAGFVLRQIWVHPSRLDEYAEIRARLRKAKPKPNTH